MAILRCAGKPVFSLVMTLPLSGRWTATLDVDTDQALSGAVALQDDGVTYKGYVVRAGVVAFGARVLAVGGTGGLSKPVDAKSYFRVSAKTVIAELLAGVGEVLDGSSSTALLATPLASWTRAGKQTAATALQALCDELGARWRVLPSGAVWVGVDTWPKSPKSLEALMLDQDPALGTVLYAPDAITMRPGFTVQGRRVGRVEHSFGHDEPLRTTAWIES
jgi:hypothetical protein